MGQAVVVILSIICGIGIGVFVGRLIARSSAKAESIDETSRLSERLAQREIEFSRSSEANQQLELELKELRTKLDILREEAARAQERASRVSTLEANVNDLAKDLESSREKLAEALSANSRLEGEVARLPKLEQSISAIEENRAELLQKQESLTAKNATLTADLENERKHSAEKLRLLEEARETLLGQFKLLATEILEEKSAKFTELNQHNIGQLLLPLQAKIQEFQGKVEEAYISEGKERVAISEQLKRVLELNQQLSNEANALTRALKGSSKTQGNWGEMILERILEVSGLRKGVEYETQERFRKEDGGSSQPDVVVYLPENKHVVIDSKVSLSAYEECMNSEEPERSQALERHIASVKSHIGNLSNADYQKIYQLNTLDFVIMFVPIESAFVLATTNDRSLWEYAWKRNIIVASPSTLLFALRTIANVWRQEYQNRNAQEIAKRGADLYEKFVGFVADLQKVGEKIAEARTAYDESCKKLYVGRGNLVRQAEMLRELGVKPSKLMPKQLVEKAEDEPVVIQIATNAASSGSSE